MSQILGQVGAEQGSLGPSAIVLDSDGSQTISSLSTLVVIYKTGSVSMLFQAPTAILQASGEVISDPSALVPGKGALDIIFPFDESGESLSRASRISHLLCSVYPGLMESTYLWN